MIICKLNKNINNNYYLKDYIYYDQEELFVILDLIYYISNKFFDEDIVKKSIDDIRIIIELILTKSFEEKKFNCTIYNFMIMIDYKYLPLQKDFDIIL